MKTAWCLVGFDKWHFLLLRCQTYAIFRPKISFDWKYLWLKVERRKVNGLATCVADSCIVYFNRCHLSQNRNHKALESALRASLSKKPPIFDAMYVYFLTNALLRPGGPHLTVKLARKSKIVLRSALTAHN